MGTESEELTESIADALTASWTEAETPTEGAEAEPTPEISEPGSEVEAIDGEDTPTEENVVAADTEEDTQDLEPEPQVFHAPEHWSSEHKESFEALDPAGQELLLARDADFQTGYQERAQGITDIQSALEPWKQTIAQLGLSEADAIRTLFATYNTLRENPLSGIQNLAQNFGVLDQINAPDTDDDEFTDPSVKALRTQVEGLQGQLQQLGTTQQQSFQQSEGQRMIDDFKSEKDAAGNPAHPHFDECIPLVVSLVSQGKALKDAYQEAVWTVPAYRESNTPKGGQTAEQKAAKVKQARKASKTVKTTKGDTPDTPDKELSLEDELTAAFQEATQ